MSSLFDNIQLSVQSIRKKTAFEPEVGIILGTGLGKLAGEIKKEAEISYENIPHFPLSTVEFHAGKLILGTLAEKRVVAMQGRFHFYEGYDLKQVTYPVRVLKALGIHTLIVSNACGGISPGFDAGKLMVIKDHINLLGQTPLMGKNDDRLGPRFPDMYDTYAKTLRNTVKEVAKSKGIDLLEGVYSIMSGPCLETAAEYRMLKMIGADVVGMSTVPEVIVAVHAGLKVLGLSVITDNCDPDTLGPVDIKKIIATAGKAEPYLITLICGLLEKL